MRDPSPSFSANSSGRLTRAPPRSRRRRLRSVSAARREGLRACDRGPPPRGRAGAGGAPSRAPGPSRPRRPRCVRGGARRPTRSEATSDPARARSSRRRRPRRSSGRARPARADRVGHRGGKRVARPCRPRRRHRLAPRSARAARGPRPSSRSPRRSRLREDVDEAPPLGLAQGIPSLRVGAGDVRVGRLLARRERRRLQSELLDQQPTDDDVVLLEAERTRLLEEGGRIGIGRAVVEEHHLLDEAQRDPGVVCVEAPGERFAVEALVVELVPDQPVELGPRRLAAPLGLPPAAKTVEAIGIDRHGRALRRAGEDELAEPVASGEAERAEQQEVDQRRSQDRRSGHRRVSASRS
jgi:hypothetical protein